MYTHTSKHSTTMYSGARQVGGGRVLGGSFVHSTVEPPVGGGSFVHSTVEPLYKGQVGDRSLSINYTVEPLYKGQVGGGSLEERLS